MTIPLLQHSQLLDDPSAIELLVIILLFILVLVAAYVIRIHIAYRMAKNRHRDPLGWVLLSFFFSPLLTWIILLIVGDETPVEQV